MACTFLDYKDWGEVLDAKAKESLNRKPRRLEPLFKHFIQRWRARGGVRLFIPN